MRPALVRLARQLKGDMASPAAAEVSRRSATEDPGGDPDGLIVSSYDVVRDRRA